VGLAQAKSPQQVTKLIQPPAGGFFLPSFLHPSVENPDFLSENVP
jgi:hypothetical protein